MPVFKLKKRKSEKPGTSVKKLPEGITIIRPVKATLGYSRLSEKEKVQVAAAQLRVTVDKNLGEETPGWVKDLAAKQPLEQ
ncbi:hypothetical protein ACX80T_15660 [Arthrobacter sp. Sr33]|uniref:hypothetical protein n=1 Tax=Arthrobacter sp. TB 23 TaxID=494419 RepID=UPI00036FF32A|nr:hypothetical protein [Arthrobacter sp. TB 23]